MAGLIALKTKLIIAVVTASVLALIFVKLVFGYKYYMPYLWRGAGPCYNDHHHHPYHHDEWSYSSPSYHSVIEADHPPSSDWSESPHDKTYNVKRIKRYRRNIKGVQVRNKRFRRFTLDDRKTRRTKRSPGDYEQYYDVRPDDDEKQQKKESIKDVCKRRFLCEADVRSRRGLFFAYARYFIGGELASYRDSFQPRSLEDCAKKYRRCPDSTLFFRSFKK